MKIFIKFNLVKLGNIQVVLNSMIYAFCFLLGQWVQSVFRAGNWE